MLLERQDISSEMRTVPTNRGSLADRWHRRDSISELVDELIATGRREEAKLVGAILTRSDQLTAEDAAVNFAFPAGCLQR